MSELKYRPCCNCQVMTDEDGEWAGSWLDDKFICPQCSLGWVSPKGGPEAIRRRRESNKLTCQTSMIVLGMAIFFFGALFLGLVSIKHL